MAILSSFSQNPNGNFLEVGKLKRIQGVSGVGFPGGHHSSSPGDKLQIFPHLIRQLTVYKRLKSDNANTVDIESFKPNHDSLETK